MFAVFDDVITKQECEVLKSRIESWYFFNRSDDLKQSLDWTKRALNVTPNSYNIKNQYEKDYKLTEDICNLQEEVCKRVINLLESRLNLNLTLDTSELQTWPMNTHSSPHIHSANGREQGDFNSLLYLNDDFNGGEFYTENGLIIRPKPGRLTFFDGRNISHGVADIYDKNRYTMIFWWKNTKFN